MIHPQHWPEDADYAGKRVVVIGSGATAVTLVPAMAADAAKVTMLQRSPTYVISLPGEDPVALRLRKLLPDRVVYPVVRWKNVLMQMLTYRLARKRPEPGEEAAPQGAASRRCPPATTSTSTSSRSTTPGTSASASSPTATSSR